MTRGAQSAANIDMQREAAGQQANMNLKRQGAQANAGLNWSDLLSRLSQNQMQTQNSVTQPFIQMLMSGLI